ncbi:hypothetical protein AA313_de0201219 [Arthrobotrys entomopaga]|nr:hypothetical protein AA313_de0201219 [Arthrobotrys entomopaga]
MFRSALRTRLAARQCAQRRHASSKTRNASVYTPATEQDEMDQPYFDLNNGTKIPALGYQAYIHRDNKPRFWKDKLHGGWRHIDMHSSINPTNYLSESLWYLATNVLREEIFVTGKLENHMHHNPAVSLMHTLRGLRTGYLDLWVMKWPMSWSKQAGESHAKEPKDKNGNKIDFIYAWKEMEKAYESGKVKALGIANFSKKQVEQLLEYAEYPPQVHQMEITPYLQQNEFVRWNKAQGITVASYNSTLSTDLDKGHLVKLLYKDPVLNEIADKHRIRIREVIAAWHLARGEVSISFMEDSATSNAFFRSVLKAELDESDMQKISTLDKGLRLSCPIYKEWELFTDLDGADSSKLIEELTPDPTVTNRYKIEQQRLEKEAQRTKKKPSWKPEENFDAEELHGTLTHAGALLPFTRSLEQTVAAEKPRVGYSRKSRYGAGDRNDSLWNRA